MIPDIELVSIGTELLNGRTLNTHAQTLGGALGSIGLRLSRDTTVPDEMPVIQAAVREALERAGIVLVSGGLGPTCDDITRDALAAFLGCRIVMSPDALQRIRDRMAQRGRVTTPAAERQALVLEGAAVLPNPAGMAPGERLELLDGKTLFILPGPPTEFSAVLEGGVLPWLRERFSDARPHHLRVLTVCGMGESDVVTRLDEAGFHPGRVAVGFYPAPGRVEIRLSAPECDGGDLELMEQLLRGLLSEYLGDGNLEGSGNP